MMPSRELVIAEMRRVLQAYEPLRALARYASIQQPVIFGGAAVFLCAEQQLFRPHATAIAPDLDLLIRRCDIQEWQELLGKPFKHEETDRFHGQTLKLHQGGVEVDLMAIDEFRFPDLAADVVLTFDQNRFPPVETVFEGRLFLALAPALHVAFKLLLWRDPSRGKHDPDDVAALLLCHPISCRTLLQAIQCPEPSRPALSAVLRERLGWLARQHPGTSVEKLYREFCLME